MRWTWNRWTILAIILLLSTGVGLLYLPFLSKPGLSLTPLFYTAVGLTTLQAGVVVAGPTAAILLALSNRPRSVDQVGSLPALTRISAPIGLFFANFPKFRGPQDKRAYTSAEYALASYEAVRILWWTYFTHLGLGYILLVINVIVLETQRNDWIFPPAFSLIAYIPPYAGFAAVLHMVYTRTYSNGSWESKERYVEDGSPLLAMPRKPYIGAFVAGWLIVPIVSAFYLSLAVDLR